MKEKIKEKSNKNQEQFIKALEKKALGYDATEIVEEYSLDGEGEIKLSKKKVTKKNVPPDITALKILIDNNPDSLELLTDEQLEIEKQKLLKLLEEENT